MSTIMLIHHLLTMFATPRIHWALIGYYHHQLPGMPATWYPLYIKFLIWHYPHAMQACVTSFHGGWAPTAQTARVCP